jgi:3-oxoacyl-[acyl-carrier protein] reductase
MASTSSDKVCVVTGAAGGIGSAIVRAFLSLGMKVVAVDLTIDTINSLVDDEKQRANVYPFQTDLSDINSWESILNYCEASCGPPDILVNSAGIIIRRSIQDSNVEEWERQVSVNLKATYFLSKVCAKAMRKKNWGRIINLSSQAAQSGGAADCPIYAVTKGGIETMTRSFAREYSRYGITVNAVAPGVVMTDMISKTLTPERISSVVEQIPIGRVTEAAEIAAAVVYLSSEQAGSVTGHILDVTGGMAIR